MRSVFNLVQFQAESEIRIQGAIMSGSDTTQFMVEPPQIIKTFVPPPPISPCWSTSVEYPPGLLFKLFNCNEQTKMALLIVAVSWNEIKIMRVASSVSWHLDA